MASKLLLLFACAAAVLATVQVAQAVTDADILNFALNLEYLEAEFYSWAAHGHGLSSNFTGGGPASVGGKKANLSPAAQQIANEIAADELAHVKFLRSALGAAAVPMPAIDIGMAFEMAANAALKTTLATPFDPYGDDALFFTGAFIFEDVGVTAYKGAAPLIASKTYLSAAAGILAVEAYHAGIIRLELVEIADEFVFPYGAKVGQIVKAISDLRDLVDGRGNADESILGRGGVYNLVPADANAIAFSRTTTQVLDIVYLGSSMTPGGFFPNGLNGLIK